MLAQFWFGAVIVLITGAANAADGSMPPTRTGAEISRPSCGGSGAPCGAVDLKLVPRDVALGLVAFNSPYLFGAQALHDGITCQSCHADCGLSGPAVRLVFDAPVPRLHGRRWRGPENRRGDDPDLEAFARRAIVDEFDGPMPDPDIVSALAAYVRQLPDTATGTSSHAIRLSSLDVAITTLALVDDALGRKDLMRLDFLVESARFVMGQEDAAESGDGSQVPRAALIVANDGLKAISRLAWAGHWDEGRRAVEDLAELLRPLSPGPRSLDACSPPG
jgi:hypothetical protein